MKRKQLRRSGNAGALIALLAAAAILLGGSVGSTFALWQGQVDNANSNFAAGWVDAPSSASASASGYDVDLGWSVGAQSVTGQELLGVDNGTDSDCTGAAYGPLETLSATASSYTDVNRGTGSSDGDWFCYDLESTSATTWTADTTLPAVQLGLAATAVSVTNGAVANHIDQGDTITITFNQPTNVSTANIRDCVWSSGVIVLGDTTGSCGSASDAYSLGKLTLSGATITGNSSSSASSVAVSSSTPWTVTATLGTVTGTSTISGTPTWTFVPSSSIETQVTTLASSLSTGGAITALPVAALTGNVGSGDTITVVSGSNSQNFTVASPGANAGSTSIPVSSQTPNFAFSSGSSVIDATDEAAACTSAHTTCQPTTSTSF